MKIGFFDSGLGGLTILKAAVKVLPDFDYYFYGDTEHLPYGDRTEEEIYEFTKTGMRYLFEQNCALVIIACNTASAATARRLQQEFLPTEYPDRKILGIIVPTVEELVYEHPAKAVLLATKRTVESGKYDLELQARDSRLELTSIACPELVPLIELNELGAAAEHAVRLVEQQAGESEVVVLGCTHYTQIKKQLREHFGNNKEVVSQDEVIPEKLQSYLVVHPEIESKLTRGGERIIHLTKHRPDYDLLMSQFLGGAYVGDE